METKTNFDIIRDILKCQGGYITRKDINAHDIPSAVLSQYVKKFGLVKYDTGFYARPSWKKDEYLIFQYEYPKLIYSFSSAAHLHHLIDDQVTSLEVTAPKNYRPFPLPRSGVTLHTDTKDNTYQLGIMEVATSSNHPVKVYDLEKTICDLIKNKNKIDKEFFIRCLSNYKRRPDKNIINLLNYAKVMKIEHELHSLLDVILSKDYSLDL